MLEFSRNVHLNEKYCTALVFCGSKFFQISQIWSHQQITLANILTHSRNCFSETLKSSYSRIVKPAKCKCYMGRCVRDHLIQGSHSSAGTRKVLFLCVHVCAANNSSPLSCDCMLLLMMVLTMMMLMMLTCHLMFKGCWSFGGRSACRTTPTPWNSPGLMFPQTWWSSTSSKSLSEW